MGLNCTAISIPMPIPFRASSSSSHRHVSPSLSISTSNSRRQRKRPSSNSADKHRRRKWWRLCRDDHGEDGVGDGIHRRTGDSKRSSLGEYLEVERRFGDDVIYDSAVTELEGAVALFAADGKVLPPASVTEEPVASVLCRFPVYLTGICSGGSGG